MRFWTSSVCVLIWQLLSAAKAAKIVVHDDRAGHGARRPRRVRHGRPFRGARGRPALEPRAPAAAASCREAPPGAATALRGDEEIARGEETGGRPASAC